jgi:hypothetical protein
MYKRYYDIDVDAKAYANRIVKAGGRIPSDIGSVSDFIKKLKINGLWIDLVDCWLMRSIHNVGTGTTLYSLKNNQFNATLTNGPTWESSGINFSSANSAAFFYNFSNLTLGDGYTISYIPAFLSKTASAAYFGIVGFTNAEISTAQDGSPIQSRIYFDATSHNITIDLQEGSAFAAAEIREFPNMISSNYHMLTFSQQCFGSYTKLMYRNGTSKTIYTNNSGSPKLNDFRSGTFTTIDRTSAVFKNYGSVFTGLKNSATFLHKRALTAAEHVIFYNIVKSTIGKGVVI